jgi:hypothetical protein
MSRDVEGWNDEEAIQMASEFYEESFRCALKPGMLIECHELLQHELIAVFIVCQFFGLFPLDGLTTRDLRKLQFKWKSPRTLFTGLYVLVVVIYAVMSCYKHFYKGELSLSLFTSIF